jgi:hypothetical protein
MASSLTGELVLNIFRFLTAKAEEAKRKLTAIDNDWERQTPRYESATEAPAPRLQSKIMREIKSENEEKSQRNF